MQTLFSLEEKTENCWNSTEGMNSNLSCSALFVCMFSRNLEVIMLDEI